MSHYAQNYTSDEIVHSQRRRMIKHLITALLTVFSVVALSANAFATPANQWSASISSPANTTNKTFNVQYATLSTEKDDDITVELFENGVSKGAQTTVKDFGGSGVFSVTVPAVGTYSYTVKATNNTDPTPKTTGTVAVVVSATPQATTTTNTANTPTGGQGSGTTTAVGSQGGAVAGDSDGDGIVDDKAAVTEKEAKDVLGDSDKNGDDKKDGSQSWGNSVGVILLLLGIAGGYYYMVMRKANKD